MLIDEYVQGGRISLILLSRTRMRVTWLWLELSKFVVCGVTGVDCRACLGQLRKTAFRAVRDTSGNPPAATASECSFV